VFHDRPQLDLGCSAKNCSLGVNSQMNCLNIYKKKSGTSVTELGNSVFKQCV
jgi:hypothetical protein